MNAIYEEVLAALHSVWHRRWLALLVAWGVCIAGWLVVAMIPNSYQSRARIFVQLDDALANQIGIGVGDRKRDIERVRQTLTTAVNLEKVVKGTRIGEGITTPKETESAVLGLAENIQVVSQQDNLFEISAESSDSSLSDAENAKLAQDIVQKMIDIFREENLAGGRGEMTETLEFMNQQLADRQKDLEAAEQRRLQFEQQHPELAQGGMGVLQRTEAARAQMRDIEADLAAAQSALASINGQLAGTPQTLPGVTPNGVPSGARGALGQAQAELTSLRAQGKTDNHPDVITLKNQISQLRQVVANEPVGGAAAGMPNPAYSSLISIKTDREATIQALTARRASLQGDIAQLTTLNISNPEAAGEAQRISRDYDVLKQQYDKLLKDREELRLQGQVESEHSAIKFQVVDPPTTPRAPIAPNRPLLLMAVLAIGLACGIAFAFAIGQMRNTFATAAKLEKAVGLPVLGAISTTLNDIGREKRRKRQRYFVLASAALGGLFVLLMTIEAIQVGMVA